MWGNNKYKTPQTKKQVRSFLGAIGYYRRYIQNFALIAKPLHKLTWDKVSNSKVLWDESCEIPFQTLKQKLLEAPILGHMDYSWDSLKNWFIWNRYRGYIVTNKSFR